MTKLNFPISVVQMSSKSGDVRHNLQKMLAYIAEARSLGAKLVVFPELATSGYMLGDRWEDDALIREIQDANDKIRRASKGLVVVWGSIVADWDKIGEDGRLRKYNAALIAEDGAYPFNGTLAGFVPKTNLPKYRIFDDARHFYPAAKLAVEMNTTLERLLQPYIVTINGDLLRLGLAICEDLWEDEYNTKPSQIYGKDSPDLLIDLSHSPWTAQKWRARDKMLHKRVEDAGCPILYINAVGLQNNGKNLVWFDGGSKLVDVRGDTLWSGPLHEEKLSVITPAALVQDPQLVPHKDGIAEKYDAVIAAMRTFYEPFGRVVVGLSGGIDSAVSLAMLVEAVGAARVLAINMPTQFNSQTTRSLAEQVAKNFGVEYRVVPIQDQYEARLRLLALAGYSDPSSFDRENIQARIRGQVLADIIAVEASRIGRRCAFTNNGNKTEVALNYFTEYGDGAGTACFLGDLWKGEVFALATYINERAGKELIPWKIIKDLVPSAELSEAQNVDAGKGDPIRYDYHDYLLRAFHERRLDPSDILRHLIEGDLESVIGCEPLTIAKYFKTREAFIKDLEWAWGQYSYEGKRHKLPPVFITSRRAFGFDRRETIADAYLTEEYRRLHDQCLGLVQMAA